MAGYINRKGKSFTGLSSEQLQFLNQNDNELYKQIMQDAFSFPGTGDQSGYYFVRDDLIGVLLNDNPDDDYGFYNEFGDVFDWTCTFMSSGTATFGE